MPAFDLSIPPAHYVETEYEARQWLTYYLQAAKVNQGLGLDSETSGITKHRDVVMMWSLSDKTTRIALPAKFIQLFKEPILENPEIDFDLTNAKFDMHMFANTGADISKSRSQRCTLVQSFLLNENRQGRHGLKECMKDYLNSEPPTFESVFGRIPPHRKGTIRLTQADLISAAMNDPVKRLDAINYSALDAYNTTRLRQHFDYLLSEIEMYEGMTLLDFFYRVEVPFTKVLWNMERRGFLIDAGYLWELKGPMEKKLGAIEKEFNKRCEQVINLRSTGNIRWFFFELLKKAPIKWTDGGTKGIKQPSVDAEVLEEWAGGGCPWSKMLLEYRGIDKIKGTYVDSLMDLVDPNYRIHTTLNQIGAQSGRLSSSDPNLQNIPAAREDQFKIRDAFIAGQGMRLVVADYAQLEMRLMAHFSTDQKMIDAILKGIDLHCFTVSEMYGIPYDECIGAVKAEKLRKKDSDKLEFGQLGRELTKREEELLFMRQSAKATGFGIIYGIGGPRLAAQLTKLGKNIVTEAEGYKLIDRWFSVFPGVRDFIESKKSEIRRFGCVQTITGRFRRAGDLGGMSKKDASQAERTLINAIIQGTAADIAKASMLKAENDPELISLGARLLLQVHDELIFECPLDPDTVKKVKIRVQAIMEDPFGQPLLVPIPAEVGDGWSWASAK